MEYLVVGLVVLAIVFGLPIYCLVRVEEMRQRIAWLDEQFRYAANPSRASQLAPKPAAPARPEPAVVAEPAQAPEPALAPEVALVPEFVPAHASLAAADATPRLSIPEPEAPRKQVLNWEMFAGGRMLNALGAIVLVIGVGLFLKYAFDQNWITFAMRVAGGVALGGALLAFGEFSYRRQRASWFSQGIIAAGIGVLYVSGHAAFASYHLVPFAVAYGFMSLVTIAAFLLAVRYDALSIALLAWLGGFITPFVLNDGIPNEVGLASYLVLLDLGIVAVAMVKGRWIALEPLALAASYVAMSAWYSRFADSSDWFVSTIALSSIWLLFFAASVAQALRARQNEFDLRQLLGIANAGLFWAFAATVLRGHDGALQTVLAAAAGAYAIAYVLLLVRAPMARPQRIQYYATGLAFVLGWSWLHFPNRYESTVAIAAASIALVAIDMFLRKRTSDDSNEASVGAAVLLTLQCLASPQSVTSSLLQIGPLTQTGMHFDFAFGARDLAVAAAGAAFVILQALTARQSPGTNLGPLRATLRVEALLALAIFTAAHFEGFALAEAYALEAVGLALIGTRGMLRDMELAGLAFLAAAGIAATNAPDAWYYERIFSFDPWHNGRLLAILILPAAAIVMGELFRQRSLLPQAVGRTLRIVGAALAVTGVTLQVRDMVELARAHSALDTSTAAAQAHTLGLGHLEGLAISAVWIAASLLLVGLGVGLRIRDLRLLAIGLFGLTIGKAFFVDLGSLDGLYRIAAFIGLGLVLLGVSYIYVRLEQGTPRSDQADDPSSDPLVAPA